MSPPERPDEPADAESSFIAHLLELRNRLLYAIASVGVVFLILLPFSNRIYTLLARPLLAVLPKGAGLIATDVTSPFLTPIKLTLAAAVVAAVPFVLYQIWAFVAPGLYRHEKRLILPLLVSSVVLFYCGMAFAYFVVFPFAFTFFVHSAPEGVTMMTDIKSYLDFVFAMFFAFGVAFEVPVAIVILVRMGIVSPDTLASKRPYVVLWVFIIAAVLTPPDVYSQTMLALPMYGLFELGLLASRLVRPREAAAGQQEPPDPDMDAEIERHERELGQAEKERKDT